jgi:thioesterase domain-containing protein
VNHGTGPRVFCVPGAADTPLQYRPLGRRLPGIELWAFTYRGLDTRALPDQSVAAIARRNVAALREVEPTGPYRLLGYSLGGAVALEMARGLTAAGEAVELVALLEPPVANRHRSRMGESRAYAARVQDRTASALPGRDLNARLARARTLARVGAAYASRQVYIASAGLVRRRGLDQHNVFFELHRRVLRAHTATPFHGRAVVFASPQFFEHHRQELDRVLPPESAGGGRYDVEIAGEHLDLVREPNVAEVARALDLVLATDPE